jgi:threonyl-tRNA synthetase
MPLKIRYADGNVGEITDPGAALEIYRHSTSHLMAAAVCSLFPGTHLGIGTFPKRIWKRLNPE